jgi:hypothetical protein
MSAAFTLDELELLVIDDDADDIDQLIAVICESASSRRLLPETFDLGDLT